MHGELQTPKIKTRPYNPGYLPLDRPIHDLYDVLRSRLSRQRASEQEGPQQLRIRFSIASRRSPPVAHLSMYYPIISGVDIHATGALRWHGAGVPETLTLSRAHSSGLCPLDFIAAIRNHIRTGRPLGCESLVACAESVLARKLCKRNPSRGLRDGGKRRFSRIKVQLVILAN